MSFEDFINLVVAVIGAALTPDHEQRACLEHDPAVPLLIVAGPGSGKTTVLVLRALRHVLIDRVLPEKIMITTFTRKAAKEIRTRLIEWGTPMVERLSSGGAGVLPPEYAAFLHDVDVNRFVTGTLDSLCEEALSSSREPDERPPVVVEAFAASQMLARRGDIRQESQQLGQPFVDYLALYTNTGDPPANLGEITRVVRTLVDRFVQDGVDLDAYLAPGAHLPAREALVRIYRRYTAFLNEKNQMDFPALERAFLQKLRSSRIPDLVDGLGVLLVDEYQDTNPLQEQIYLELARRTAASFTVVGDDDQSLYRFRGATIELFRDFATRSRAVLGGTRAQLLYLTENYRSTPEIVSFFNGFIQNDPDFDQARVQPPKPLMRPNQPSDHVPVLGMFRSSADELATDLAVFLQLVFRQGGWPGNARLPEPIRSAVEGGDVGDAVVLGHTVNEFRRPFRGSPAKPRFPWLLRQELDRLGIRCFNPRGRALKDIPEVALALGLVEECLDPAPAGQDQGPIVANMAITRTSRDVLRRWRSDALGFLATNPPAVRQGGENLLQVVTRWRAFARLGRGAGNEWPLLDVIYNLLPWIAAFQDGPEHQVYLEAISRAAAEAATFSGYRALILRDEPHRTRSVEGILRDVLAPVADDLVEVDEDIMPSVPRDRLNFMTIHQAKGLEFPLVIVDVSSDFKTNHRAQRFRRFPDGPSPTTLLEDDLAPCTPIGGFRTARSAIQRSFEDLIRLYYVAYSRPQNVLLLVGCIQGLRYEKPIAHVAKFWRRDGSWPWRLPAGGGRPPSLADNLPFNAL